MARRIRPCRIAPIALVLPILACGAPPCASSAACAAGMVCGLDGRCAPLGVGSGVRFTAAQWMSARDWGIAAHDARLTDVFAVGGPARSEGLLTFGPLPTASRILRALLVLHPHASEDRVDERAELVVEHVEPFRGGPLPPRARAGPLSFAAARSALAPGPARPLRIDLTAAARNAAARRDRNLYLLVRVEGSGAARFASPWALGESVEPRLELLVH